MRASTIAKLDEVLRRFATLPFEWGASDCVCLAGACGIAITGKDFVERFRPYTSELSAMRRLRAAGFASVEAAAASLLPDRQIGRAETGDLGVYRTGELGVVIGSEIVYRDRLRGNVRLPLWSARRFFALADYEAA